MKVVSFAYLSSKKKKRKHFIYCTRSIFKPFAITMGIAIVMLTTNLLVSNFFNNLNASLRNFVDNFAWIF